MIPEKVFQQILALGEAQWVMRMDYHEKEQRVLIRVEETPASWNLAVPRDRLVTFEPQLIKKGQRRFEAIRPEDHRPVCEGDDRARDFACLPLQIS